METLETIRQQLATAENAFREKRLQNAIQALQSIHGLLDGLSAAFILDQVNALRAQIDRLAEIGLVVNDLDAKLTAIEADTSPTEAAAVVEEAWTQVRGMLEPAGKLLVRTNIFPRGKKTFLTFEPEDTLADVASTLKSRYRDQIVQHLHERGVDVVVPDALDIIFFNSLVWERPDEAILSEHTKVAEIVDTEVEGLLWFPVLPGEAPTLFGFDEDGDDEEEAMMSILENFTIEADISQLEDDMRYMAKRIRSDADARPGGWRSRAYLLRGAGTPQEERIPLVGECVSLGRGRENDIQILNDGKVSRFHCRIVREGDAFFIEDNSSSNGTVVNGDRVTRLGLQGGERLEIGNTVFLFLMD